jgi:hypothetical protein
MGPKWFFGDGALATALVKAVYEAKNKEVYRLRKAALEQTMEAEFLTALAAKVSGRPSQEPQYKRDGSSENAATR